MWKTPTGIQIPSRCSGSGNRTSIQGVRGHRAGGGARGGHADSPGCAGGSAGAGDCRAWECRRTATTDIREDRGEHHRTLTPADIAEAVFLPSYDAYPAGFRDYSTLRRIVARAVFVDYRLGDLTQRPYLPDAVGGLLATVARQCRSLFKGLLHDQVFTNVRPVLSSFP